MHEVPSEALLFVSPCPLHRCLPPPTLSFGFKAMPPDGVWLAGGVGRHMQGNSEIRCIFGGFLQILDHVS